MAGKRVIFVPGFMGTNLYRDIIPDVLTQRYWVSGKTFTSAGLNSLRMGDNPGDGSVGNLFTAEVNQGVYSEFLRFLVGQGHDVQAYGYDWRGTSPGQIQTLRLKIRAAVNFAEVDAVICHSYGGCLMARVMNDLTPGERAKIKQVITVGSPFRGAFHPGTSLAKYGDTIKFMSLGVALAQLCRYEEAQNRVTNTLSSWDATYTLMPAFSLIDEMVQAPNEWTRQSQVWVNAGFEHNGPKGVVGAADMDRGWQYPAGVKHTAIIGAGIATPGPFLKPKHKFGDNGHSWVDGDGVVPVQSSRPANGQNASVWTVRGEHDRLCSSDGSLRIIRDLLA